ncbi:unnamed protein product [Parnassius apollo]|uniref:(apollo) hypothetical protein n=1 Tax=Parnassius apollo TaxID=110799 RepID=A0A8S3YCF8_PARAO|nr:unnamed protein product [Parnassius apollo]
MFKLLLCALFAVAAAEPGILISPSYVETYSAPATTTVTRHASSHSVINTPYYYPQGIIPGYLNENLHFIKKRSAPLISTYGFPTTYLAGTPWTNGYSSFIRSNPLISYSPIQYTPGHLIKKRSAVFAVPSTYYTSTPYASSSYYIPNSYATTYSSALLHNTPLISTYGAQPHFIKKRSAAWAPTSYAPFASSYIASGPLATTYSTAILPNNYPYWSSYAALPIFKKK